jgi:MoaA/NifB/PqqE/SkfB family radical SAM enzyme
MPIIISKLRTEMIWMIIRLRIFYLTCIVLKWPRKILKSFSLMANMRNNIWGGNMKKIQKVGNEYYSNMYAPPWPSAAYDEYMKTEIVRYSDPLAAKPQLSFVFLAITRKCPLRCEHCFEADNLNSREIFTKNELFKAVQILQKEGVLQFHFSGGEPMVRIKDLIDVIKYASRKSACWVATSGFNLTIENALALKKAGCKGVIISIDHYIPELHNAFRHHPDSYRQAVEGVYAAKKAGLAVCLSVCTTKQFIDTGSLLPYMHFAKKLGVHFVQALEPKNVGNYGGKDVLLHESHFKHLEKIFLTVNHAAEYRDFPTMLYHGYHHNRIGCFAGSRSIYIDSIGDVHACPFCHTKSYNILELIRSNNYTLPEKENACPRYKTVV